MLMDLATLDWDEKTLETFEIKDRWLPTIIKSNAANFGTIDGDRFPLLAGVPIGSAIGD